MRCMDRNKTGFYYALYVDKVPVVDEYGNETGESRIVHGNPVKSSANISAAKGETSTRQFGEDVAYDKVIAMDNAAPPIDEYAVLWIDTAPQLDDTGALATDEEGKVITPHDYVVKKVATSLNSVFFAVSKVTVSG